MCARVRAEVEAEMLLKQMEGLDNEVQSKTTTNIERAVPAIHTCWKLPIFFWESILVGNEINSVKSVDHVRRSTRVRLRMLR